MAFRLNRQEKVYSSVRRIAAEQIHGALGELKSKRLSDSVKVHQLRKHCKKLRALVRLVHSVFEDHYKSENQWFRDTARPLSAVRDAHTIVKTYDSLVSEHRGELSQKATKKIRRELTSFGRTLVEDAPDLSDLLVTASRRMTAARDRALEWSLDADGFEAVRGGLEQTYRCARQACSSSSADEFHEWRKHVKYHWYHCRLLRGLWPQMVNARRREVHRLAEALGDHHDLTVLRTCISEQVTKPTTSSHTQVLLQLIDQEHARLETESTVLGQRLFAETTREFSKRFGLYWAV